MSQPAEGPNQTEKKNASEVALKASSKTLKEMSLGKVKYKVPGAVLVQ